MGIFKTRGFARFARKTGLSDQAVAEAARAISRGQWDADLGGGVFKQRVARDGAGKSGGFRVMIIFKIGRHAFVVHGFAKNTKANVSAAELKALKRLAATLLTLDAAALRTAVAAGELIEVNDG